MADIEHAFEHPADLLVLWFASHTVATATANFQSKSASGTDTETPISCVVRRNSSDGGGGVSGTAGGRWAIGPESPGPLAGTLFTGS